MDHLKNEMEIIVTRYDKKAPMRVTFEDLYALQPDLKSIMLLWNTNCYYVDCVSNTFLINGGRSLAFPNIDGSEIDYRRRTTMKVSAAALKKTEKEVSWLIGLKSRNRGESVYIEISQDGTSWNWRNTL